MSKKSILIYCYTLPYPPIAGGRISLFATIDELRKFMDVCLLVVSYSEEDARNMQVLKLKWPDVTIHEIKAFQVSTRISLKQWVKSKFLSLLFPNKKKVTNKKYLTGAFQFPFAPKPKEVVSKLVEVTNAKTFDFVQIEFTENLNLIHVLPAGSKKVYVEIESRYKVLQDYFSNVPQTTSVKSYSEYVLKNVREAELHLMSYYDAIIALNRQDESELSSALPNVNVYHCPYPVLEEKFRDSSILNQFSPKKLLFMGSENHYPNVDALEWFIAEILPLVSQDLKLYITGKWSDTFSQMHGNEQVIFTGFLDSLDDIMNDSIMVIPIRIGGGGIRAKILEAMAFGIPVVSTNLAAVGVNNIEDGTHLRIANTIDEFSQSINELSKDTEQCKKLIENANALIRANYSQKVCIEKRMEAYMNILNT